MITQKYKSFENLIISIESFFVWNLLILSMNSHFFIFLIATNVIRLWVGAFLFWKFYKLTPEKVVNNRNILKDIFLFFPIYYALISFFKLINSDRSFSNNETKIRIKTNDIWANKYTSRFLKILKKKRLGFISSFLEGNLELQQQRELLNLLLIRGSIQE